MSLKVITREELDLYFNELAKGIKKKLNRLAFSYELIIVGGASILLNYTFRGTTVDIDCVDYNGALLSDLINQVGDKYDLPHGWINTDFMNTSSYSSKIVQYSTFYKSYCNDSLIVRTVKDEYLLAMKMVSARKYKNDYSDIVGIINANKSNPNFSFESIQKAVINLYDDENIVKPEMYEFVKKVLTQEINIEDINEIEKSNKDILLKYRNKISKEDDLENILKIIK